MLQYVQPPAEARPSAPVSTGGTPTIALDELRAILATPPRHARLRRWRASSSIAAVFLEFDGDAELEQYVDRRSE
jgi:hypothetical protein